MAVTRVNSTQAVVVGVNAGSLAISMASQTAGHFQLLFCSSGNSAAVPTTPTGWTLLDSVTFAYVFYRVNDGTEASSLTVTYTGGTAHIAQVMVAYSGVDPVNPFESPPLHATASNANNPQSIPALTTTLAGDWIVGWAAPRESTATNSATAGTALTIVQDAEVASATFQSMTVADSNAVVPVGVQAASGITYSTAPTSGASGSLALAPTSVPPGAISPAQPGKTWLRRFHHQQVPQQAPAAVASAVTLAETGAADDSSFAVAAAVPLAESGTAADTLAVTVAVPLADSGSGADTLAVSAAVPLAESGAGTETLATGSLVALAEAGTGADTLSATAAVPLAESGTGADAQAASAAVPLAESGTGADALSVSAAVPLAEGGTGADTLSVAAGGTPALAESGTGADALSVSAAVPLPEAATGTDTFLGVRQVAQAETGSGSDAVALSAAVPLAEGGSGAQALGVLAQAALTEAATALDTLSVATVLPFTIGTLTASDAPGAVLTAAAASSTLTAATDAQAALTAADQRTGGPGG